MRVLLEWAVVLVIMLVVSTLVWSFVTWDWSPPWEWGMRGRIWCLVLAWAALQTVRD